MIQLLIAISGAIGAVARFEVGRALQPAGAGAFPWATFVINVAGSIILGFVYRFIDPVSGSASMRAFLGVGFCGGFTTFSAFSYDAVRMMQSGDSPRAAAYIIATVLLCMLGTLAGMWAAASIART